MPCREKPRYSRYVRHRGIERRERERRKNRGHGPAPLLGRQAGHPAPMLPIDLFRWPMFALSATTAICTFAVQELSFVSLPFYFEDVLARSQAETGFFLTPWPLVVGIMAPIAGRLSDRYSVSLLGLIGLTLLGIGRWFRTRARCSFARWNTPEAIKKYAFTARQSVAASVRQRWSTLMHRHLAFGLFFLGAAILGGGIAGQAAPNIRDLLAQSLPSKDNQVDVELILAVDVSYSMDMDELAVQREGYAQAVVSPEFLQALKTGPTGRIAVTYFEWAASTDQKIVIPWRIIDGPESAGAVADEILKAPLRRASRTSISGAINFAMPLFEANDYKGLRRVIDISGDGPNNNGDLVTAARDVAIGKGIVINGLPIMVKPINYMTMDIEELDSYYEDCVIGGPGSFVVAIKERQKFKEAIRTKLVLEVAGREPEGRVVPVSSAEPRISCTIGERNWKERFSPQ